MRLAERIVGGVANSLAVAGLTLLLVLATFTLFDGLLRALANYPLDFVREIGDLVAAICGACCLPVVLLYRNNVTLRISRISCRRSARGWSISSRHSSPRS